MATSRFLATLGRTAPNIIASEDKRSGWDKFIASAKREAEDIGAQRQAKAEELAETKRAHDIQLEKTNVTQLRYKVDRVLDAAASTTGQDAVDVFYGADEDVKGYFNNDPNAFLAAAQTRKVKAVDLPQADIAYKGARTETENELRPGRLYKLNAEGLLIEAKTETEDVLRQPKVENLEARTEGTQATTEKTKEQTTDLREGTTSNRVKDSLQAAMGLEKGPGETWDQARQRHWVAVPQDVKDYFNNDMEFYYAAKRGGMIKLVQAGQQIDMKRAYQDWKMKFDEEKFEETQRLNDSLIDYRNKTSVAKEAAEDSKSIAEENKLYDQLQKNFKQHEDILVRLLGDTSVPAYYELEPTWRAELARVREEIEDAEFQHKQRLQKLGSKSMEASQSGAPRKSSTVQPAKEPEGFKAAAETAYLEARRTINDDFSDPSNGSVIRAVAANSPKDRKDYLDEVIREVEATYRKKLTKGERDNLEALIDRLAKNEPYKGKR